MLLGHVPRHHGKDRGEGRQRNVTGKRRRHDHEDQQIHGVQHARNRPFRPRPDIGGGAGNRAGDAEATKQLLTFGEAKTDDKLSPAELAAYTTVASTLINLDETITKE